MKEYHKIETVFNRSEDGSKKLILGAFRNETVAFLQDALWVWTEKVDGTNICIHWDGHKITFGGRTDGSQIPADLVNYLNQTFFTPEVEQLFEQKFGDKKVTLYAEGYGRKIGKAGKLYRPDDVSIILFDVSIDGLWLKRASVEDIATCFGIEVVPVVGVGTISEAIQFIKTSPCSTLSENAPMEGVVIRPAVELFDRLGDRVVVKIKARDFNR